MYESIVGFDEQNVSSFLQNLREYLGNVAGEHEEEEPTEEVTEETHTEPSLRDIINQERLEAQKETKTRKVIDVSQMKKREKILNTYGFDVLEVDGNGELIYRQKAEEKDPLEGVNENALRVKMAEKKKREALKIAHDTEVKRNKELEAKRKADKEKKKTVRQERRGRGYM